MTDNSLENKEIKEEKNDSLCGKTAEFTAVKKEDIKETVEAFEETTEPEETTESEEVTEPEETAEPEEVTQAEETTESEEVTEPEETTESEQTAEPEETTDGDLSEGEGEAVEDAYGDDGSEKDEKKSPEEKNSFVRGLFELLEMLSIAIGVVVLIITFFFRFSNVEGESMTYTINEKDTLLVSMAFYKPARGDVIIFQSPDYDLNKPLVKRVIAVEGDKLEINFDTWQVKVNGIVLEEDYVRYHPYLPEGQDKDYHQKHPEWDMDSQSISSVKGGEYDPKTKVFTATIPEGCVFAMGDNRNNSHDSRSANIGMVDERYIIGKVICRLFPLDSFGPID